MANYTVNIVNGQGSQSMKAGTYTVSASEAQGYDLSSLSPTTFTASSTEQTTAFTLSANGTLTFNVNETGAVGGTPITSGTIVMTDSTGATEYGSPVSISATGDAVFDNVPYGTVAEPFTLYFKQLTSDDSHNIYPDVIAVQMSAQTQTEYVLNSPIANQNITLSDANYTGLPINATLNFDENI